VTVRPPSAVTSPPRVAPLPLTSEAAAVVTVGMVAVVTETASSRTRLVPVDAASRAKTQRRV